MKKNVLILLGFVLFLLIPGLVLADCDDLGGFTGFVLQGGNTVILYAGSTATSQFDVQSCNVTPTSSILLLKSMVCDGDEVLIDGTKCTVMNIKSLD